MVIKQNGYKKKWINKSVRVQFTDQMKKDFMQQENEKILEKQKTLIESLLEKGRLNVDLQKRSIALPEIFEGKVTEGMAKDSGMFKTVKGKKIIDIAAIVNEAGGNIRIPGNYGKVDFYNHDADVVKNLLKKDGITSSSPIGLASAKGLNGNYTGATTLGDLQTMIDTRKDVLKWYNGEAKDLSREIEQLAREHKVIQELEEKIQTARNADDGILKAKEALFKQFPSLSDGTVEKAGLTTEQAMEKDSYKKLAKIVEEKQAAYDKVAAEKGKINEGAKKTAEDALTKAKAGLEETMTRLNGAAKGLGGKTKAAIIGGTAIVGALVGKGIVDSKNKKIEAEAQNFIANV